MSTAQLEKTAQVPVAFTIEPISYEYTKAQIISAVEAAKMLRVTDHNDKVGLERCHKERMKFRDMRVIIEKKRKALKADVLERGRSIDSGAKELLDPIEEAEDYLREQEAVVVREQERLAREAAEARQAKTRDRLQKLQACGKSYMEADIADLPDDEFEALHDAEWSAKQDRDAQAKIDEAERERVAAEQRAEADRLAKVAAELEAKRVADEHRTKRYQARVEALAQLGKVSDLPSRELTDMDSHRWELIIEEARIDKRNRDQAMAAQQAALDKQRQEQEAAQAKIDAENKRIADEQAERVHREAIAKAAADAAEKARLESIDNLKRIAAAEKELAESSERERQRQEELRPDREKIAIFADSIQGMNGPKLSVKAQDVAVEIGQALLVCSKAIRAAGSKLK